MNQLLYSFGFRQVLESADALSVELTHAEYNSWFFVAGWTLT